MSTRLHWLLLVLRHYIIGLSLEVFWILYGLQTLPLLPTISTDRSTHGDTRQQSGFPSSVSQETQVVERLLGCAFPNCSVLQS